MRKDDPKLNPPTEDTARRKRRAPLVALIVLFTAVGAFFAMRHAPAPGGGGAAGSAASAAEAAASRPKPVGALSDEKLEHMVAEATKQTQADPKNLSAWAMLAHSNEMLGKFSEAAQAYEKLQALAPRDPQVLVDHADALAVAHGRSLQGEPFELVKRALEIDPKNRKALALAGAASLEAQDYPAAIAYWQRARVATTDPLILQQIDASIAQAKALAAVPAGASAPASIPALALALPLPPRPAASGASAPSTVSGRLWIAESLKGAMKPDATVFIYARPADGSRMPVALMRRKVSDLPLNFTLDNKMAMVPDHSLAKVQAVVVGARISASGDVTPHPGDLQGLSAPVAVGTSDLKLEISEVLK